MRAAEQIGERGSSRDRASISSIGLDDFRKEVLKAKRPVLVLCMHRDTEFQGQIEVIERIIHKGYGDRLKTCLLEEGSVGVFRQKYRVRGTPTFLIFSDGREMSRMLGQAEPRTLKEFLSRNLRLDREGR